jgi:hypothetical protein
MNQMLGIPVEMLWEKIPGFTDQDVDRARALIESGDTINHLIYTLGNAAAAATVTRARCYTTWRS